MQMPCKEYLSPYGPVGVWWGWFAGIFKRKGKAYVGSILESRGH